jgi:uncharacterized protein involved in exopolysaccharide biosynthesis
MVAEDNGNGWHKERADVLTQLAVLTRSSQSVEVLVREVREEIRETFKEFRVSLKTTRGDVDELKLNCAVRCQQVDAQEKDVEKVGSRLEALEEEMEKLAPAVRIVIWVGGALGVSVVALIWALITGQAQVIFP